MSRWRLGGWWPVALAGLLVAAVAIAQRPRGGIASVSGQPITPSSITTGDGGFFNITASGTVSAGVLDGGAIIGTTANLAGALDATALKGDSLQTHSGGATALNICTTGTGNCTVGNGTSSSLALSGGVATLNGALSVSGTTSLAQASTNSLSITGAASNNPVAIAAAGTNAGMAFTGTGTGAFTFNASGGTGTTTIGNATGNVTSAGTWSSSATAGNQFACTGAATCSLSSASGQTESVDCGGGTCTASLGATNATTTTIGRASQTTTINGNATFATAGPSLGGTLVGTWTGGETGLAVATTNYGAFEVTQDNTNVKFRQVACTHQTAGTGTAGTLAIRNVTDGTTLCSGTYTCTTTANTPTAIFDCNQQPVKNKLYSYQFTTGCGSTQVTSFQCTTEITH